MLLSFLLSGCAQSSAGTAIPTPQGKAEAPAAMNRETMLEENRKMFRELFPEIEDESRFFYGTMEDAAMILQDNGTGILLLGDTDPKKSDAAVKVLDKLVSGDMHVLYMNAGKE